MRKKENTSAKQQNKELATAGSKKETNKNSKQIKIKPTCMIEIYPVFNNGPVDSTFKFMLDTGFYNCFYNHRGEGLKEITSIQHGVDISHSEITIHDGDFLFVSK